MDRIPVSGRVGNAGRDDILSAFFRSASVVGLMGMVYFEKIPAAQREDAAGVQKIPETGIHPDRRIPPLEGAARKHRGTCGVSQAVPERTPGKRRGCRVGVRRMDRGGIGNVSASKTPDLRDAGISDRFRLILCRRSGVPSDLVSVSGYLYENALLYPVPDL